MNRFRLLLPLGCAALLLAAAGCPSRQSVGRSDPVRRTVERLLDAMVDEDEAAMEKLISPRWLDEQGADLDDCRVNAYTPQTYSIVSVKGDRVRARLVFAGGGAHRLEFRVREEEGKHYIVPGELDEDDWIQPWISAETNVE